MAVSIHIFVLACYTSMLSGQRIVYNTTHCRRGNDIFNTSSILPQHPPYSLSISSSTFQAGKPISITVKACKVNSFRAFLLRASIHGYVLSTSIQPKDFQLGTIMISCGVHQKNKDVFHYTPDRNLNVLKFRWIPPQNTYGNITFHFTGVPQVPSVYYLSFGKSYVQSDETHITVEQVCSMASRTKTVYGVICLVFIFRLVVS